MTTQTLSEYLKANKTQEELERVAKPAATAKPTATNPDGHTCGECCWMERCTWLLGGRVVAENGECDFCPSRFAARIIYE